MLFSAVKFPRFALGLVQNYVGSTAVPTCTMAIRQNCHRASIARTKRKVYTRTYPVKLVLPDGSSYTIRYKQPRRILVMPEDLDLLNAEEKEKRYRRMDPPKRVIVQDYDDEGFTDARSDYIERMKKNLDKK